MMMIEGKYHNGDVERRKDGRHESVKGEKCEKALLNECEEELLIVTFCTSVLTHRSRRKKSLIVMHPTSSLHYFVGHHGEK